MFWPGFAMYLVASICGVAAVQDWRRAQISPWQGMGLRFDKRAWVDVGGGVAIGALAMGGIFTLGAGKGKRCLAEKEIESWQNP